MLDAPRPAPALRARRAPSLPVAGMLVGKPPEEAAALLPRLFALCRAAQAQAARAALGLPTEAGAEAALAREVLRDHLVKFCLHWPARLSLAPRPLPAGWQRGEGLPALLWGAPAPPPTPEAFEAFLRGEAGAAPVLRRIDLAFPDGLATTPDLPALDAARAFAPVACENSVAGRQAAHPVLAHVAATRGRGPLWRAAARLYDIADALAGRLPPLRKHGPGRVTVTAARGTYAIAADVAEGRVTALARVTPTDHLLAPGGALDHALAALPAEKAALAPLLIDILDPCSPVRVEEGAPDA